MFKFVLQRVAGQKLWEHHKISWLCTKNCDYCSSYCRLLDLNDSMTDVYNDWNTKLSCSSKMCSLFTRLRILAHFLRRTLYITFNYMLLKLLTQFMRKKSKHVKHLFCNLCAVPSNNKQTKKKKITQKHFDKNCD